MCLILWLRRLKEPILSPEAVKQLMIALFDAPVAARSFFVSSQLVTLGESKRKFILSLLSVVDEMCKRGLNVREERELAACLIGPALCHTRNDLMVIGKMREYNTATSVFGLLLE